MAIYDEVTGVRAAGTVADLGTPTTTVPAGAIVAGTGTLSNDIATDVQDDAAVKNATQAWTACMTRNGYHLGQPDTVFRQEIEAMFGGTHVTRPPP